MTDSKDYRQYLESEFGHIRSELAAIKEQTGETNGKVGLLEEDIIKLKIADVQHIIDCPAMSKINAIVQDLEEYRMLKKYPKLIVLIFAILTLGAIAGFVNTAAGLKKLSHRVDIINTPVTTRSGTIEWFPAGVVIDSLEKKNVK